MKTDQLASISWLPPTFVPVFPTGATTVITTRIGQGYAEVTGIANYVAGVGPPISFEVLQGHDGITFDQIDAFAMPSATVIPFSIKIVARFLRIQVVVPVGATVTTFRTGGLLKVGASP